MYTLLPYREIDHFIPELRQTIINQTGALVQTVIQFLESAKFKKKQPT